MKRMLASVLLLGTVLAGCSNQEQAPTGEAGTEQALKAPMMAFGYTYRFALPGAVVITAQDRHIALCDRMGPARCRLQEMHRSASDGQSDGSTRFLVVADEARKFGAGLVNPVSTLGGKLTARDFEAEDVSQQSADAKATVAEKNTAANRAAEASVRERVATSTVWVYYSGTIGFWQQIGSALGAGGETLTSSIVALIYFLAGALPWVVVLGAIFLAVRAVSRRLRRRKPVAPLVADGETTITAP